MSTVIFSVSCGPKSNKQGQKDLGDLKIEFVSFESENMVDVLVDRKLFTSFRWHDAIVFDIRKPILYPIMTSAGAEITRGYPLNPGPGERFDRPHQIGICFCYGIVNGYDFWFNSTAIPAERRGGYGIIMHMSYDKLSDGDSKGSMLIRQYRKPFVVPDEV